LLVLACAVGGVLWSLAAGDRQRVLALTRAVSVGQLLSTAALREVSIAADPAMSTMAASEVSTVVGRVLATSLPAGSLLTPDVLGAPLVPSMGQAITVLALKPGMFPPELPPGALVAVVLVPSSATGPSSAYASPSTPAKWKEIVTGVTARADEQITVVSLQLPEAAARQVAAWRGTAVRGDGADLRRGHRTLHSPARLPHRHAAPITHVSTVDFGLEQFLRLNDRTIENSLSI